MIGPLVHWAIMHVRYDRRIAGRAPSFDVYRLPGRDDPAATGRAGQGSARRTAATRINGWIDWAVDAGADDPAELVAALESAGLTQRGLAA